MSTPLQQPPPVGYSNTGFRSLHLYNGGSFTQRRMIIKDSDKATNLYTVSYRDSWAIFSSKPHMSITSVSGSNNDPETGSEIGTVIFHSFSPTELTIYGRSLSLDKVGLMSRGRTFQSSSSGILTWQYDSALGDSMTCSNETNQWLARYTPSHFSISKGGVLELASVAIDGILLDEIVVTVLAVVEERKRRSRSSHAAASGGGGGC